AVRGVRGALQDRVAAGCGHVRRGHAVRRVEGLEAQVPGSGHPDDTGYLDRHDRAGVGDVPLDRRVGREVRADHVDLRVGQVRGVVAFGGHHEYTPGLREPDGPPFGVPDRPLNRVVLAVEQEWV